MVAPKSARTAAREAGEKTYVGKPCPRGHTKRYTRNCSCVECDHAYDRATQGNHNDYARYWRSIHLDHARQSGRERQKRYRLRHAASRLAERIAHKAIHNPFQAIRKAKCDAERYAVWVNTVSVLYYEA